MLLIPSTINAQKKDKPAPEFIDMWIENENFEKIDERDTTTDQIIYIVMETRNRQGEKAALTIQEEDGDFIYKNKYLTLGYKLEIKVKSDIHKIKLEVFDADNKRHQRIKRKSEKNLTAG